MSNKIPNLNSLNQPIKIIPYDPFDSRWYTLEVCPEPDDGSTTHSASVLIYSEKVFGGDNYFKGWFRYDLKNWVFSQQDGMTVKRFELNSPDNLKLLYHGNLKDTFVWRYLPHKDIDYIGISKN